MNRPRFENSPPPECLGTLKQVHLDWLTKQHGIDVLSLGWPEAVRLAKGYRSDDGYFDFNEDDPEWLVFLEPDDTVFWRPRTNEIATWNGRSFALGEAALDNAWTYSLDNCLNVYASPIDWLKNGRDGIVIRNWRLCYSRLQTAVRIKVDSQLVGRLKAAMQPEHWPEILVRLRKRAAA